MGAPSKKSQGSKNKGKRLHDREYVQFSKPLTNKTVLSLFKEHIETIYDEDEWKFEGFEETKFHLVLPYIGKIYCQKMSISRTFDFRVLELISHVDFQQLKTLELSNNKISNIEPMEFLDSYYLETLDLRKNQITNFKPLLKTVFKNLNNLKIDHNPCYKICLARLFTNKKQTINFKYTSYQREQEPEIVLIINGQVKQNKKSKKPVEPVFTEDYGPILNVAQFFVKLQNYDVSNETIHLLHKKDDLNMTVQQTQLCDRIMRKFTAYTTFKAFSKRFPLENEESDIDYPMLFQDLVVDDLF